MAVLSGPPLGLFIAILSHFGPILSHFEEFGRVWEPTGAAKACGAVKMGIRERPKLSALSKWGSKWLTMAHNGSK